jgi:hypothetical protein
VEEQAKEVRKKGRPSKPSGALTAAERQMAYRKKKLDEGVEISLFFTHKQATILRELSRTEGKTQSKIVGELLEKAISKNASNDA